MIFRYRKELLTISRDQTLVLYIDLHSTEVSYVLQQKCPPYLQYLSIYLRLKSCVFSANIL